MGVRQERAKRPPRPKNLYATTYLSLGELACPLVLAVAEEFNDAALVRREAVGGRCVSKRRRRWWWWQSSDLCLGCTSTGRRLNSRRPLPRDRLWNRPIFSPHPDMNHCSHAAARCLRGMTNSMRCGFPPLHQSSIPPLSFFFFWQLARITMRDRYPGTERHNSPGNLLDDGPHKLRPLARLALAARHARLGDTGRGFLLPCQRSGGRCQRWLSVTGKRKTTMG